MEEVLGMGPTKGGSASRSAQIWAIDLRICGQREKRLSILPLPTVLFLYRGFTKVRRAVASPAPGNFSLRFWKSNTIEIPLFCCTSCFGSQSRSDGFAI